mgnify:CR=1 FL=1
MSLEEAEIIRERANAFLKNAERLIEDKVYDLAAFNIEQYCELILKYKLLIKTGTYPRTHSIMTLIRELSRLEPYVKNLLIKEENIIMLTKIEDAYIGARYLPRRYEEVEVRVMLRFVKEVFRRLVERI